MGNGFAPDAGIGVATGGSIASVTSPANPSSSGVKLPGLTGDTLLDTIIAIIVIAIILYIVYYLYKRFVKK